MKLFFLQAFCCSFRHPVEHENAFHLFPEAVIRNQVHVSVKAVFCLVNIVVQQDVEAVQPGHIIFPGISGAPPVSRQGEDTKGRTAGGGKFPPAQAGKGSDIVLIESSQLLFPCSQLHVFITLQIYIELS